MKDDMKNLPKGLIEASLEAMKGDVELPIVVRQDLEEKLHGDQYKLDLNRNGKIDKQDFKHLRKKKQVDEALARGVSVSQLVQVKAPGMSELDEAIGQLVHFDRMKKVGSVVIEGRTYKIRQGQYSPVTEQMLDELSKKTLASYVDKASQSAADKAFEYGKKKAEADEMDRVMNRHMNFSDKDKVRQIMKTTVKDVEEPHRKAGRRLQGITRAATRLAKEDLNIVEEVNQLDELSKDTLKGYQTKAEAEVKGSVKRGKPSKAAVALRAKRGKGLENAKAKLQAIVKKEHEAEMAEVTKTNAHLDKHFEDNHHKILEKHGFKLAAQGTHGDKDIKSYIHPHENGHITTLSIHTKNDAAKKHDWGYKHEVRVVNSKGTSYSSHYPNTGVWETKKAERKKNEMMPNFEAHVIKVKNDGDSEGHW